MRLPIPDSGEPNLAGAYQAKRTLISYVNRETNSGFDDDVLTIGFARRATPYKRTDLLFMDIQRLRSIVKNSGPLQVIFAGRAHPRDGEGKELIQRIFASRNALRKEIRIAYLSNYDMDMARFVTAGSDVWLNTPEPPMEASGTGGMKAALNGVPSLSVLDGWWIEGHIEGVTGWSIGQTGSSPSHLFNRPNDVVSLYDKLESTVIPTYYRERDRFLEMMRHSIALNGSFFNTHRMIQQYLLKAYFG
jgi:glycogen phosphorylase